MAKINSYEWTTQELLKKREQLRAGDKLLLSGTIYTARDAAHKRLKALLEQGQALPFELQGAIIYYAGPTGTPEHMAIGSCGPTTASRMDPYAPQLLDLGLLGMIGKGERSQSVKDAIVRNRAVYLCALGGAGALAAKCITHYDVVAFDDLGCESVKRLTIERFPLIVGIDSLGNDLFAAGKSQYRQMQK